LEHTERIGKQTWPKTQIYSTPTGNCERDRQKNKMVKMIEEIRGNETGI
jgi:hypothetical protein